MRYLRLEVGVGSLAARVCFRKKKGEGGLVLISDESKMLLIPHNVSLGLILDSPKRLEGREC